MHWIKIQFLDVAYNTLVLRYDATLPSKHNK